MKVAFYNPPHLTFSTGPENWLCHMLPFLAERGHEVTLIMTEQLKKEGTTELIDKFNRLGIEMIILPHTKLPGSYSPLPTSLKPVRGRRFDMLYAFNGYAFQELVALRLARLTGAKAIFGIHAVTFTEYFWHNLYQRLMLPLFIRRFHAIHVLNQDDLGFFSRYHRRVSRIGYGVDADSILAALPAGRMREQTFRLITVGRLTPDKGIARLLEIAALLASDRSVRFTLVGGGEMRRQVEGAAARLGNIDYRGFMTQERLLPLMAESHALLHLAKFENFSAVTVEALASGLPLIVTDTAGFCRDCGAGMAFRVLPPDYSAAEAAEAINDLRSMFFNDPAAYRRHAEASLAKARAFTWDIQGQGFVDSFLTAGRPA